MASIQVFDTIFQLRSSVPHEDGVVAFVAGFWSVDDGGGGMFRWSSEAVVPADGGTVFDPNLGDVKGRWFRTFSGPLNVRWLGACGRLEEWAHPALNKKTFPEPALPYDTYDAPYLQYAID